MRLLCFLSLKNVMSCFPLRDDYIIDVIYHMFDILFYSVLMLILFTMSLKSVRM